MSIVAIYKWWNAVQCGMNRSVREGKNVQSFELDTALYKNHLYVFTSACVGKCSLESHVFFTQMTSFDDMNVS